VCIPCAVAIAAETRRAAGNRVPIFQYCAGMLFTLDRMVNQAHIGWVRNMRLRQTHYCLEEVARMSEIFAGIHKRNGECGSVHLATPL